MNIHCFRIANFRRLKDILIDVEEDISIFVGANNSGKTSAAYALDVFVNARKEKLSMYDFMASSWKALNDLGDDPAASIAAGAELPCITLDIWFTIATTDTHRVLELLPSLDWAGSDVGLRIQFQAKDSADTLTRYQEARGKLAPAGSTASTASGYQPWPKNLVDFIGRNLQQEYEFRYYALDQANFDDNFTQNANYQPLVIAPDRGKSLVRSLIKVDALYAQRFLTEQTSPAGGENLSKCLGRFYQRNLAKRGEDHDALKALFDSETQFNEHLKQVFDSVLKRLSKLGYPGVHDPHLVIKSDLKPTTIMNDDTKVYFSLNGSDDGMFLPDAHNGLGFKNLIYMVVEVLDIQARWLDETEQRPLLQLIIIEEPEAHLHAQLQQVFIRQILSILQLEPADAAAYKNQLIVTTHSPHILFERGFRPIRYFRRKGTAGTDQYSESLNLSKFYQREPQKDFLERYMKLTHCDLFFADGAVLVEGNVERLLLPLMIEKCAPELKPSYVSILEVGGAYAYRFKSLIEFLGIPALVITDLDSVKEWVSAEEGAEGDDSEADEVEIEVPAPTTEAPDATKKYRIGKACMPAEVGAITSNQTLVKWMPKKVKIEDLLAVVATELEQLPTADQQATVYITFQRRTEVEWKTEKRNVAGRTLEEAFALENAAWCQHADRKIIGLKLRREPANLDALVTGIHRRVESSSFNKTNFALGVMAQPPDEWKVPTYIQEGLKWLENLLKKEDTTVDAESEEATATPAVAPASETAEPATEILEAATDTPKSEA